MILHCILLIAVWKKKLPLFSSGLGGCTDKQTLPGDGVVYLSHQLVQTQQLLIVVFLSLLGICAFVGEAQTCPGLSPGYPTYRIELGFGERGRGINAI